MAPFGYTAQAVIGLPDKSYTDYLDADSVKGARFGVLKEAFGTTKQAEPVNVVMQEALEKLKHAGAELIEVSIPNLSQHIEDTSLYLSTSKHDLNLFFQSRPNLPVRDLDDIKNAKQYHSSLELVEPICNGPEKPENDPLFYKKLAARELFRRTICCAMASKQLNGLIFPVVQILAPKTEEINAGRHPVLTFPTNTVIGSQTSMPSISLPAGFAPNGLPGGLELLVYPHRETDLFRFGSAIEKLWHAAKLLYIRLKQ